MNTPTYHVHHTHEYIHHRQRLLYAVTVRPKSLYEDVHAPTGHPGYIGMRWHQQNIIGANYTHCHDIGITMTA